MENQKHSTQAWYIDVCVLCFLFYFLKYSVQYSRRATQMLQNGGCCEGLQGNGQGGTYYEEEM